MSTVFDSIVKNLKSITEYIKSDRVIFVNNSRNDLSVRKCLQGNELSDHVVEIRLSILRPLLGT